MCIAIYSQGDGEVLPPEWFNESMRSNPDGMGIAWIDDDGQFKVVKSLHRGDIIYSAYVAVHESGKDCILHFRKTTHGDTVVENCHPFFNGEDEVFVHNGILKFDEMPDNVVDSALFGERILSHLPDDWRDYPDIVRMIEKWMDWSKIIILRRDGLVTILNEHKGQWEKDKGLWFSNSSFRPPWRPKAHTGKKGKRKGKNTGGGSNLPVVHRESRSWYDHFGYGENYSEWWERQQPERTTQEELDFPDEGTYRGFVEDDDPFAASYPDGYDYQGYEICTYCIPMEWVDAPACYPIFFDEEAGFKDYECCSCTMLITQGSPKRMTIAFDRDTLLALPESIENVEDSEVYDA